MTTHASGSAPAAHQPERYRATALELLERSARRTPDAIAAVDEKRSCTYGELFEMSQRAGSALIAQQANAQAQEAAAPARRATSGPRAVILFMEKRVDALAAMMGALMAGGFYVPVDPMVPEERAASIYETISAGSPAPIVVTCADTAEQARRVFPRATILRAEELVRHDIDEKALARAAASIMSNDPAYVLFTSGSTGTPKGVAVSHQAILGFIEPFVETMGIRAQDILGNQAPLDFDVSVKDIYGSLAAGATILLLPRRLFSAPAELVETIRTRHVTVMIWAVAALCLVSGLRALEGADLPEVRLVGFSGEVMPLKHLHRWMACAPHATFVNLYGPTEVTCNCLFHILDRERGYEDGIPLGIPFPNRRVTVLDSEQRPVTEPGGVGELYAGGPCNALGYFANPERTSAAFIQNPLTDALPDTVYKTGDLVRLNERGELIFCGRVDNQIKHQGHRIELEEIDAAFERQPGVDRCRCAYDEKLKRIHAFFEGTSDAGELRRAVAHLLPVPMLPASITQVDAMPLTKNGKVDRRALLALKQGINRGGRPARQKGRGVA
ncbi:amino acid adenylation domain-containing protein [Enorma phocaeensis]|uniref:Amino acid adenylation domain-containing protein n=1 Tax=Enorma phocaeensis TaxID=1871019 RepID=A0A921IW41_9ACTN|nr:amino acid adenylation domain-containing protein [Enorma phocaeensis]HJG37304.1 amino acid adenylation domain-containing protein [Enorma phocaeensis]